MRSAGQQGERNNIRQVTVALARRSGQNWDARYSSIEQQLFHSSSHGTHRTPMPTLPWSPLSERSGGPGAVKHEDRRFGHPSRSGYDRHLRWSRMLGRRSREPSQLQRRQTGRPTRQPMFYASLSGPSTHQFSMGVGENGLGAWGLKTANSVALLETNHSLSDQNSDKIQPWNSPDDLEGHPLFTQ